MGKDLSAKQGVSAPSERDSERPITTAQEQFIQQIVRRDPEDTPRDGAGCRYAGFRNEGAVRLTLQSFRPFQ